MHASGLAKSGQPRLKPDMSKIHLHKGDLPASLEFGPIIAVDTEAMGLNPVRDALTVVQLSSGDGEAHVVQLLPQNGDFAFHLA